DVAEDGASTLITRGLLNLAHRNGHEEPEPLEPGRRETVTVRMKAIGQVVPPGHRLRVAISQAYWPWMWPSPQRVTLTVHAGPGRGLELPVRAAWQDAPPLPGFGAPEQATTPHVTTLALEPGDHSVSRSIGGQTSTLVHSYPSFHALYTETGTEIRWREPDTFTIHESDPLAARVACERVVTLSRGAGNVTIEASGEMAADDHQFLVTARLSAFEGQRAVHAHAWSFAIPRDNA